MSQSWPKRSCLYLLLFCYITFYSLGLDVDPQVKVMTEPDLLAVACEQFLGKSVMEIKAVVLQTLEGHLRSILGRD